MANPEHLDILKQGVEVWNQWREENPSTEVLLSGADLSKINISKAGPGADFVCIELGNAILSGANLSDADLTEANLTRTCLYRANLSRASLHHASLGMADLSEANLSGADLHQSVISSADLSGADLSHANLIGANLMNTNLIDANLRGANLRWAELSEANLSGADLTGCSIYGISAWNVQLKGAKQKNLYITKFNAPQITVDNLEVAQFINLLLDNERIRDVIDTITSKVVLILGRFTPERKAVLDAIRDELRKRNYLPVLFDFDKPANRDITETVSTLAHLARFVIADITEPKSIPQELNHIIPFLPSVPIVPLLQESEREYGMYEHFISYPWVQSIYHYRNMDDLLHSMQEHIIDPAERKVRELTIEKAQRLERL